MHFRPEAQRHFIAADGSRIICRERQEPASNVSVLRQAEHLQRWPIVSPMVNDAHVSVAIQGHIAREGQISPRMCAVAIFLIRPAVDARPQTRRLLLL
jgi:hypothetical protein